MSEPVKKPRVGSKLVYFVRGPKGQFQNVVGNPKGGIAAHKARRQRSGLGQAVSRRAHARAKAGRDLDKIAHILKAQGRARRVALSASTKRRGELAAAIARLERAGVVTALSSPAQQRRGTIPAGPRAKRLRALQRALERRRAVNPKTRKTQMAKLARNRKGQFLPRARNAAVANPKKRRKAKRRAAPAAAKARRRKPKKAATARRRKGTKRRYPYTVTFRTPNPDRVSNPRRRRRRRNPSFGGIMSTIKSSAMPMVVGGVAGLGAGYMDAKLLGTRPTVSVLAKVGLALIGAAALGGKRPLWAAGWAGGMIGSTGYHAGVRFGGGMVGLSPQGALKGIADMAADDPEMANMIAGLADVVDNDGALGDDAAADYNAILEEADDMADVVEAEG